MQGPLPGMLCGICGRIMTDPVVAADGYSYERTLIEEWFRRGRFQSPSTHVDLPNLTLIPNHSLRQAIESFIRLFPHFSGMMVQGNEAVAEFGSCLERGAGRSVLHTFSTLWKGSSVTLVDNRTAERSSQAQSSLETLSVFLKDPLRIFMDDLPGFTFKLNRKVTRVSGPRFGICDESPEEVKPEDLEPFIESHGYFMDESGWFRDPSGNSFLASWNPGKLHLGDIVTVQALSDGSLAVVVNGKFVAKDNLKIALEQKKGKPFPNYWGFVTLSGLCTSVIITHHNSETAK